MNLREQFESELDSTGVKLLFESSAVNYIKWLEDKNEALTKQLRIGAVSQQRELLSEYENFKLIKQDLLQNRNEFINEFLKERNCG